MTKFQLGHKRAARITADQVLAMRERYARGETQGSLARAFHLSVGQVGRIVRGESWQEYGHIPTDQEIESQMALERANPAPLSQDELAHLVDVIEEKPAPPTTHPEDYAESIRQLAASLKRKPGTSGEEEKEDDSQPKG